jgi:hypothetical protein
MRWPSWLRCTGGSRTLEAAKQLITPIIELLRQRGASAALAFGLTIRGDVGFRTGQWSSAYADDAEALQWAEEMQQLSMIGYSLVAMARIEAARGQRGLCEEHIDLSLRRTGPSGTDSLLVRFRERGRETQGEPDVAVEHLRTRGSSRPDAAPHPGVVPFVADLVEAYIRCGRHGRAVARMAGGPRRRDGPVYAALPPTVAAVRWRTASKKPCPSSPRRHTACAAACRPSCAHAAMPGRYSGGPRPMDARKVLREAHRI